MTDAPRDPFDYGIDFKSSADRVKHERDKRLLAAERALPFYHPFLDDAFRAILPNDLILLAGVTGAGKTELARSIAAMNARKGKRVHYFALEAEPDEIERRTKFSILASLVAQENLRIPGGFNYADWYLGRLESHLRVGDRWLDDEADEIMAKQFASLYTLYRERDFTGDDVGRLFLAIQDATDLIVLDHLHYVDIDDENESRGFKATMKLIRRTALEIGKPVILVAHIRKLDPRMRRLVPVIDDVHGSSDIAKICTRAIMFAPATKFSLEGSSCALAGAGTYFGVPKDRISGALQQVALCDYNLRTRRYEDHYTLGYATRGDKFDPIGTDAPWWARGHRPVAPTSDPHWQEGAR